MRLFVHRRQLEFVALLIFIVFFASGCWNRREIETLGFVMAVGIDRAQQDGKIQVTMLVSKPFALGGAEGSAPEESSVWMLTSTGDTVFEAIRNGSSQSPRFLFFAHNRWILFGEQYAREGVRSALDVWSRDGEARRTVQVAVAKAATAFDALQTRFELEQQPSEGGRGVLRNASVSQSAVVITRFNDFVQMLEMGGVNPVVTRLEIVARPFDTDIRQEVPPDKVPSSARFTGAAAFKEDRLVGWLDKTETRGLNWVLSDVRGALLVVDNPQSVGKRVGIEILRGKAKNKIEYVDGRFKVFIRIEAEGILGDSTCYIEPQQSQFWDSLERRAAEAIRGEIRASLVKAQTLQSDYFGFGTLLYRSNPKLWDQVKEDWLDVIFPRLEADIEVSFKMQRTGLVNRSDRITRK